MNKLAFLTAAVALAVPLSASAVDGTITITGEVVDTTCVINTGTPDIAVTLPTVSTNALAQIGDVAGRTPFTISLTGCGGGDVAAYFEPGPTVAASGRLINGGAASNVEVQLLDADHGFVNVGNAGPIQFVTPVAGAIDLAYFAEYYATGAADPGTVSTSVQYTIVYN